MKMRVRNEKCLDSNDEISKASVFIEDDIGLDSRGEN
jgi:hypothetical protein